MSTAELRELVQAGKLKGLEIIKVLRNPYCTVEIAEIVADNRLWLTAHQVRELLAGFQGLPMARAMNLLATLPWLSLLELAKAPRTPPPVRRSAEKKILHRIATMTLGEKIALSRRAHRPLFKTLIETADAKVLCALLDNPYLVENDVLLMLNTIKPPPELVAEIARHQRWGCYYGVRLALAESRYTPLPIALSAMVQLRRLDLKNLLARPDLRPQVKDAATALLTRNQSSRSGKMHW